MLTSGDQQIYIQKIIRGAVGLLIMVLEVYEVFYLHRLHRCGNPPHFLILRTF
jgi:hypothetical protein